MTRSPMTLTELAPGVYAWVQPDGSWFINNAGAVHDQDDVVLIDTCATAARTRRFLTAVADATSAAPIRIAINTHWHGDHTFGNELLPPSTVLVSHEHTRNGILADTMLTAALPPIWSPIPDWGVSRTRAPTVVLHDELTLYAGNHRIELHNPGHEAHTHGDVVAWLPEQRVLFTGDLLFHHVTPLVLQGSFAGALRAVDWLRQFPAVRIVPGHGPLIDDAEFDEVLNAQTRYYQLVQHAASAGLAASRTPLQAARDCDLGEFTEWPDHHRIVLNLHRAYADATGAPMDLLTAFTDTTTFNGGALDCAV
ncbi:MBL fold metallo-hydrolase [Pseudonocardia sp. Cha107L01]|uniref:MBL fold metallo-hydrolase n=1 Tax=Pseudonocardia sp. Cha107L01 TaxID=3457576 RepID=UPI00403EEE8C